MIVTPSANSYAAASLPGFSIASIEATPRPDTPALQHGTHFTFRHGLFGFPGALSFQLVPTARAGAYWLRGDEGSVTFLVIDPFEFFPGCVIDVPDEVVSAIGAEGPSDVLLLAIVTLGSDPGPTANLQGPVAFNPRLGLARQFVVTDQTAPLRAPLVLQRAAS